MIVKSSSELIKGLKNVELKDGSVKIKDAGGFREKDLEVLLHNATISDSPEVKGLSRWLIWELAIASGAVPSSIQGLYEAWGKGEYQDCTVPAVNIRGLTYDTARALVRAAMKNNAGPFVFEIAKSEIGYTEQRPDEYSAVCLAACLKEGYRGPVFIQGDHFQVSRKKYAQDPSAEIDGLKKLIKEAVDAGFYNIDIDSSTMVDISKEDIKEQQKLNFEIAAEATAYIRQIQPQGITVSVGGEIGEIGKGNSTPEELRAFMEGYRESLSKRGKDIKGITKISVQTGTTHGGVPLPDGTVAKVKLDFDTLKVLSKIAREDYGLSGAVQHGASTLPDEAFDRFPKNGTAEVHLATGFQNIIYESSDFPSELRGKIYEWLKENCASDMKEGMTEEQFIYKTRKKGFGPFKKEIMNLPEEIRDRLGKALEDKFDFLFKKLQVAETKALVKKHIAVLPVHKKQPGI